MNADRVPFLIIVRGLPGAGKSTLVDYLSKNYTDESPLVNPLVLSPDQVNLDQIDIFSLLNNPNEQLSEQTLKYRFLLRLAQEALLLTRDVLWDQPWRSIWGIRVTQEKLTEYLNCQTVNNKGFFRIIIVEVLLDEHIVWQRLSQRLAEGKHGLSRQTFEKFVNEFEWCNAQEFLVCQVDGFLTPSELAR